MQNFKFSSFSDFVEFLSDVKGIPARRAILVAYNLFGLGALMAVVTKYAAKSFDAIWTTFIIARGKDKNVIAEVIVSLKSFQSIFVPLDMVVDLSEKEFSSLLALLRPHENKFRLSSSYRDLQISWSPEFVARTFVTEWDSDKLNTKLITTTDQLEEFRDRVHWGEVLESKKFSEKELWPFIPTIAKAGTCFSRQVKESYSKDFMFEIFMAQS